MQIQLMIQSIDSFNWYCDVRLNWLIPHTDQFEKLLLVTGIEWIIFRYFFGMDICMKRKESGWYELKEGCFELYSDCSYVYVFVCTSMSGFEPIYVSLLFKNVGLIL